jgi:hypothetical protein
VLAYFIVLLCIERPLGRTGAHTMTDEISRADVLASELRRFSGWYLLTHCPQCGSSSEIAIDVLIKRYGGELAMYTAVQKLECLDCKIAPDEVHLWRKERERDGSPHHVQLRGENY